MKFDNCFFQCNSQSLVWPKNEVIHKTKHIMLSNFERKCYERFWFTHLNILLRYENSLNQIETCKKYVISVKFKMIFISFTPSKTTNILT